MLERYKILHELGRGATGAVYAASDRSTGAVIALKRLDPALLASDASLARRFLEHARSARRLKHRNIVEIHDAAEAAGTAYVAMEMLEGQSLRKILDEGPLPIARAIRIAHEAASGLAHAHLEGAMHGAIKPSNVLVLRSGAAKITDFGTGTGGPGTLSPEQARGDRVDHRSDIFSLGALFYEMLTRRRPFEGDSPKEPPPPSELNPHVPRALDAVVLSMLARDPAARMPGVPLLLRELERLEEGLGLEAGVSARTEAPAVSARETVEHHIAIMERESAPERSPRSRPAVFATLALVLAVLGIGLAGFMGSTGLMGLTSVAGLDDLVSELSSRFARKSAPPPVAKAIEEPAPAPAAPPAPLPASAPLAIEPAAKVPAQKPDGTARLILAVSPRGELYIDGEHRGTTPPVTTFEIEPGMRRIEVRNGSRRPYLTYMTVGAGDVRRIRHDFNAKPIRPPR